MLKSVTGSLVVGGAMSNSSSIWKEEERRRGEKTKEKASVVVSQGIKKGEKRAPFSGKGPFLLFFIEVSAQKRLKSQDTKREYNLINQETPLCPTT